MKIDLLTEKGKIFVIFKISITKSILWKIFNTKQFAKKEISYGFIGKDLDVHS